ncbi:hypothetical protein ALQ76_01198 [Pseudomonas syringae pv. atrofaciens]|uniref:DUF7706 family protein n=1 Tax=Pseudomonas syringae TaxID=317 RepID=UPI000F00D147|nr:hypothetical protein [Pseudomonas syringae]RMM56425.1 hypothetical protein ALQ76_01198 [Pseudomonas syringae pv. atrofaciens]
MSDSPDLIMTAENPRTDETASAEFERAEACALARLVRSLTLGDCCSKAVSDDDAHLMNEGLEKLQNFFCCCWSFAVVEGSSLPWYARASRKKRNDGNHHLYI